MNKKVILPLIMIPVIIFGVSLLFTSDILILNPQLQELTEPTTSETINSDSLLSKLQNARSYENERHIILEFVDSYKSSATVKNTLGDELVLFFSKSLREYPDLVIAEKIFNPRDRENGIVNEYYWNDYNVYFTLKNFHEKTLNLRFSINVHDEKISWIMDETTVAGQMLEGSRSDTDLDNNFPDTPLKKFLLEYYDNDDRFTNMSESEIVSKLYLERFEYNENRKNPESWWAGRVLSGDDARYEIQINDSIREYHGSIYDSDWNPDGSWTWRVEKPDQMVLMNSNGEVQINSDGTVKTEDVTATAEAILLPDGSGNFTLTHSYSHSYLANKTEGIFNADGSWIVTTYMNDGSILESTGNFDGDWTGVLVSHANFEKRFINSDDSLTMITLTNQIQKTCISGIEGGVGHWFMEM